jgi:hypothetical protein
VPDDVVLFGRQAPGRADMVRELFLECYGQQVLAAFKATGDLPRAEEIAIEAFSRVLRRGRAIRDPAAAHARLDRAVARLAGVSGSPAVPGRRAASPPDRPGDVERAWAEVERRTREASRARRRRLAGCAALAGLGAAAIAAGPSRGRAPGPVAFPSAVVARIPLPGAAALAADRGRIWVLTASLELVGIDTATNKVTLREPVPGGGAATNPGAVQLAAGDGTLWIAANTIDAARLSTRLLRISPANGRVLATINIGGCVSQNSVTNNPVITYGAGRLWIGCLLPANAGYAAEILRVNPATDQVDGRTTPIRSPAAWLAAGRGGLWDSAPMSPITQVDRRTMRSTGRTVSGPAARSLGGTPIALAGGALWALADGKITEIGPGSGQVRRAFRGPIGDRGGAVPAGDFAVSGAWMWLTGPPITRVSVATGRVLAQVAAPWASRCCGLIAVTPGAVWVSTGTMIVRLDPDRIPPGPAVR